MSQYKDLSALRKLPRSPALSYLRKQMRPRKRRPTRIAPVLETGLPEPVRADIGAFTPAHLWNFISHYLKHRLGRRHPFPTYKTRRVTNGVYQMHADGEIRIALAGDWATGTVEAAKIADLIERFKPHYAIHLGDVYYVGDPVEVAENFLGIPSPSGHYIPCRWPRGSLGSFALNGNHEMYSLGTAYFSKMLPALGPIVNGRARGQAASFFCLENAHWRIIALDTAYNSIGLPLLEYFWPPDGALPAELMDWLREVVKPARDDPRGIVLLSHHQYFSRFERWYTRPAKQLTEFFSRPVLWFWGHEHRLAIYRAFGIDDGITAYGRCIGHGGMPVELPHAARYEQCVTDFVDERSYPNAEGLQIGFNGFARLSLQQERLAAEYVDVLGTVIYSEAWTVENGTLKRLINEPGLVERAEVTQ